MSHQSPPSRFWRRTSAALLLAIALMIDEHDGFTACGDAERSTPEFRAAQACESAKAASDAGSILRLSAAITSLQSEGFCRFPAVRGPSPVLDSSLCADPNGFVCGGPSGPHGRMMTPAAGSFTSIRCPQGELRPGSARTVRPKIDSNRATEDTGPLMLAEDSATVPSSVLLQSPALRARIRLHPGAPRTNH